MFKGLFAEYLGIRPWEMDLLTVEDFEDLVGYLKATLNIQ